MDELLIWVPDDVLGHLRKVDAAIPAHRRLQVIDDWHNDGGMYFSEQSFLDSE
jgi:hypothetical protein